MNARVRNVLSDGLLLSFLTYFNGTIDSFHLAQVRPLITGNSSLVHWLAICQGQARERVHWDRKCRARFRGLIGSKALRRQDLRRC